MPKKKSFSKFTFLCFFILKLNLIHSAENKSSNPLKFIGEKTAQLFNFLGKKATENPNATGAIIITGIGFYGYSTIFKKNSPEYRSDNKSEPHINLQTLPKSEKTFSSHNILFNSSSEFTKKEFDSDFSE